MGSILYPFLLLHAAGALADVQLEPKEAAVLQGKNATFNCSVNQPWTVMSWMLENRVVLTISRVHGILGDDPHYTAHNHSHNQDYKWEFVIVKVLRNESGQVSCDVQNIQKLNAKLIVQEMGTVTIKDVNITATRGTIVYIQCQAFSWYPAPDMFWCVNGADVHNYSTTTEEQQSLFHSTSILNITATNNSVVECLASVSAMAMNATSTAFLEVVDPYNNHQTVVIAVTVTVVAVVLIVLIIILAVIFCKRRRSTKSSYQQEAKKTMSPKGPPFKTEQGTDNPGFATDSHTGVISSRLNDSGLGQSDSVSTLQMPNPQGVSEASSPNNIYNHHSAMKQQRHATIV